MRRVSLFVTCVLLSLLVVVPAYGQQPPAANDPHHPGPKTGDMPMMDMCRHMMGADMMGASAMGGPADPKDKAHMLEMRGEMMKAMGDIMMKHAQRMQGTTAK